MVSKSSGDGESRESSKRTVKMQPQNSDLESLDVKSMKTKSSQSQTRKKPEDDAWDLLNN